MNRINSMIGIAAMVAGVAFAQKDDGKDKVIFFAGGDQTKVADSFAITTARFGMMGPAVKGAPYAADGVTETTQTLGDGTHISRQETYSIYRDGEGRVRRDGRRGLDLRSRGQRELPPAHEGANRPQDESVPYGYIR